MTLGYAKLTVGANQDNGMPGHNSFPLCFLTPESIQIMTSPFFLVPSSNLPYPRSNLYLQALEEYYES